MQNTNACEQRGVNAQPPKQVSLIGYVCEHPAHLFVMQYRRCNHHSHSIFKQQGIPIKYENKYMAFFLNIKKSL